MTGPINQVKAETYLSHMEPGNVREPTESNPLSRRPNNEMPPIPVIFRTFGPFSPPFHKLTSLPFGQVIAETVPGRTEPAILRVTDRRLLVRVTNNCPVPNFSLFFDIFGLFSRADRTLTWHESYIRFFLTKNNFRNCLSATKMLHRIAIVFQMLPNNR